MKIAECQVLLTEALTATYISVPDGTHLGKIASSVLEMTSAYESDGITFFKSGDFVNTLASFYYGFGWLHFGTSCGLLASKCPSICPFKGPHEILPVPFRIKLQEKTSRYAHLLDTALSSVTCGPDPATISYRYAGRILFIAMIYYKWGDTYQKSGALEDALARFSYGHGWLDAGVTAGFFRIEAKREIFTV
jgi:hypothetical protein